MQDQGALIWLVALENIVSFASPCIFPMQPSTETSLFLHVFFCFVKVLFYFIKFLLLDEEPF